MVENKIGDLGQNDGTNIHKSSLSAAARNASHEIDATSPRRSWQSQLPARIRLAAQQVGLFLYELIQFPLGRSSQTNWYKAHKYK